MSSLKVKEVKATINNALDELDESENIGVEQYLNTELIKLNVDIIAPINELLDMFGSDWKLCSFNSDLKKEIVYFGLYNVNKGLRVEMIFKATLPLSIVLPIFITLR